MKKIILLFIIALSLPALSQAKRYGSCITPMDKAYAKIACASLCLGKYKFQTTKRKNCNTKCYYNICHHKKIYPL